MLATNNTQRMGLNLQMARNTKHVSDSVNGPFKLQFMADGRNCVV